MEKMIFWIVVASIFAVVIWAIATGGDASYKGTNAFGWPIRFHEPNGSSVARIAVAWGLRQRFDHLRFERSNEASSQYGWAASLVLFGDRSCCVDDPMG